MTEKPAKEVFKQLNEQKFHISQREIARNSDLGTSLINRFVSSDSDISSTNLLTLIDSMPIEFQKIYWRRLLPEVVFEETNLETLIETASIDELIVILQVASNRLHNLTRGIDLNISENKLCA